MKSDNTPEIFTLEQAAAYLQIESSLLEHELERKTIPGLKIGGSWRISREIINQMLGLIHSTTPNASSPTDPSDTIESVEPDRLEPIAELLPELPLANENIDKEEPPSSEEPTLLRDDLIEAQSNPPELLSDPLPAADKVATNRFYGEVYLYNLDQQYARAALDDARKVIIHNNQIINGQLPKIGDHVEMSLRRNRDGSWEGVNVVVLDQPAKRKRAESGRKPTESLSPSKPKTGRITNNLPSPLLDKGHETQSPTEFPPNHASSIPLPTFLSEEVIRLSKKLPQVPREGTPRSKEIYQRAAAASLEGRTQDARRLFREAIEQGGGAQVYITYFKMADKLKGKGGRAEARRVIQEGIARFPDYPVLYEMYGQMERRTRKYQEAAEVFREGLNRFKSQPQRLQFELGLAYTLVQLGTEESLREAGDIFSRLEKQKRLKKDHQLYQRFRALSKNPRANQAYDFFRVAGTRIGIASQRNLPWYITDLAVEIDDPDLKEQFGLMGTYLVRCFRKAPQRTDLLDLINLLQHFKSDDRIGLQDGRNISVDTSVTFIAVEDNDDVQDMVLGILGESNEAIVPLDDEDFRSSEEEVSWSLHQRLTQYLGLRNLYDITVPVWGRRFFGREQLLKRLTSDVRQGQFVGIFGLRKMGKTSLIHQLRDEKLGDAAIAYVDLLGSNALIGGTCEPLYWELERDLYKRLDQSGINVSQLLRLGKYERFSEIAESTLKPGQIFNEDIRGILDAIIEGKLGDITHLVIVLDELERILPVGGKAGPEGYLEFFALLRGLAQNERYRGLLSSVVVAANASISERGYWEGRENPVFAFYKSVFLPPLEPDECEKMIVTLGKQMSVYWDKLAIKAILVETAGHPFFTRLFCSHITKKYKERPLTVTRDMVQEQILPFIRGEDGLKLDQITELLVANFPQEERVLEKIALEEDLEDITDESLSHLMGYHLIRRKKDGYWITMNMLRRRLLRRAGIKE